MTRTQREIIERAIKRAETGPSIGYPGQTLTPEEAERQARAWAETWIAGPLRAVLRNADGEISARDLGYLAL